MGNENTVFGPLPHPTSVLEGAISMSFFPDFSASSNFSADLPLSQQYEVLSVLIAQGHIVPAQEGAFLIRQMRLKAHTICRARWRQEMDELAPCVQSSDKICWISQWQLSFHSQREKLCFFPFPLPQESIQLLQRTAFHKQCLVS